MNINIKAEPGSNVQVTDKPIYNITNVKGDLVQNKTVIYQNADDSVEENETAEPNKKTGVPPKNLFFKNGNEREEDVVVKRRERDRFVNYLKEHNMSSNHLTSAKEDKTNKVILGFMKKWIEMGIVAEKPSGAAVCRFLTCDCEMKLDVEERSFGNLIGRLLDDDKYVSREMYKDICACFK